MSDTVSGWKDILSAVRIIKDLDSELRTYHYPAECTEDYCDTCMHLSESEEFLRSIGE